MAPNEPPGEFAYLWDGWDDPDEDEGIAEEFHTSDTAGAASLPELPWYRTKSAVVALGVIASGVVAIVVSVGLLVAGQSHPPREVVEPAPATTSQTAAITAATLIPTMTSAVPIAPPTNTASEIVVPTYQPRPTKAPEITVLLPTPITRPPISVRPTPHPAFPHN